jgi:hypothetical protein
MCGQSGSTSGRTDGQSGRRTDGRGQDGEAKQSKANLTPETFRGRLLVAESPYESPYNSLHDLYANRIGIQLFFCHPS